MLRFLILLSLGVMPLALLPVPALAQASGPRVLFFGEPLQLPAKGGSLRSEAQKQLDLTLLAKTVAGPRIEGAHFQALKGQVQAGQAFFEENFAPILAAHQAAGVVGFSYMELLRLSLEAYFRGPYYEELRDLLMYAGLRHARYHAALVMEEGPARLVAYAWLGPGKEYNQIQRRPSQVVRGRPLMRVQPAYAVAHPLWVPPDTTIRYSQFRLAEEAGSCIPLVPPPAAYRPRTSPRSLVVSPAYKGEDSLRVNYRVNLGLQAFFEAVPQPTVLSYSWFGEMLKHYENPEPGSLAQALVQVADEHQLSETQRLWLLSSVIRKCTWIWDYNDIYGKVAKEYVRSVHGTLHHGHYDCEDAAMVYYVLSHALLGREAHFTYYSNHVDLFLPTEPSVVTQLKQEGCTKCRGYLQRVYQPQGHLAREHGVYISKVPTRGAAESQFRGDSPTGPTPGNPHPYRKGGEAFLGVVAGE